MHTLVFDYTMVQVSSQLMYAYTKHSTALYAYVIMGRCSIHIIAGGEDGQSARGAWSHIVLSEFSGVG